MYKVAAVHVEDLHYNYSMYMYISSSAIDVVIKAERTSCFYGILTW